MSKLKALVWWIVSDYPGWAWCAHKALPRRTQRKSPEKQIWGCNSVGSEDGWEPKNAGNTAQAETRWKPNSPLETPQKTTLWTPWLQLSETGCRLLASRTIREYTCYFKRLSLWLFVTTAIQYKGEANTEGEKGRVQILFEFFGLLFIERCRKSFCWVTFCVKDDFHINKGIILSCLNAAGISVKKSTLTYLN